MWSQGQGGGGRTAGLQRGEGDEHGNNPIDSKDGSR